MFPHPDTVYAVRLLQMQERLAEAQWDRLAGEATAGRRPRPRRSAAIRLAVGTWLVGIGEHIKGVPLVPEPGSDAVTA